MDEDEAPWWVWAIGIFFALWILSQIPAWVYVTAVGLAAAAFAVWLLGVCGVYRAIGSWWAGKPIEKRIRFRKRVWWTVLGASAILLCGLFPVGAGFPLAVLVALAFAVRRFVRRAESAD